MDRTHVRPWYAAELAEFGFHNSFFGIIDDSILSTHDGEAV